MADSAISTAVSAVHPLQGSTPPGGGRPVFRPTTEPKPRPQIRPRNDGSDLQTIAARLVPLIKREHGIQRRMEMLELHQLLPDEVIRLGHIADRMSRRIDRWTRQLIAHEPADAQVNAVKAEAYVTLVAAGWTGGRNEVGEDLALSVAQDALRVQAAPLTAAQAPEGTFAACHAEVLRLHAQINAEADDDAANLLMDRLAEIDRKVLAERPTTLSDAVAALMYARRENFQYAIEVSQQTESLPDRSAALIQHLLDGAIAVLNRPVVDDAELLSLLAQHRAALVAYEAAEKAREVPYQAYPDAVPPRPKALYWIGSDRVRPTGRERVPGSEGSWYYVYDADDIERMRDKPAMTTLEHRRPAPWDPNDTIVRKERVPDEVGEARRVEIIAAWDSWEVAQEAVIESTGLGAANDAVDAASEALNAIEDAILETTPRTVEGLLAKARWVADKPRSDLYLTPLFRDLCAALPSDMPGSLADDGALRDAVAQFREVDFRQLYLCSAYEADCDQIPGYEATEAPWRSALVEIADHPAQTWAGIVAKAEVIKTQSVWHDRDLSESIGDSIAEDVLRLAGRSWDPKLNRVGLTLPAPSTEARAA